MFGSISAPPARPDGGGREGHSGHRRGPRRAGLQLIIDSTGLSIAGAGDWAPAHHGDRGTRGWKTLPVGVDHTGVIVVHARTDATVDDATTGVELIEAVNDDIANVTADAAYDTVGFYDAAGARGATVVVPPTTTARVSRRRPRPSARDHTINTVKSLGRRRGKQTSRDHQHARVENAFFRYQSIIGDGLRARTLGGRTVEAPLACTRLNAMPDMGRPASYAVGRCSTGGWDRGVPVSIRDPTPPGGAQPSDRWRARGDPPRVSQGTLAARPAPIPGYALSAGAARASSITGIISMVPSIMVR